MGPELAKLRGRGLEYLETRDYLAGDDVRHIDWRVAARTGLAHTKVFTEERGRPVLFSLDLAPSMFFGSRVRLKALQALRLAIAAAWRAVDAGDRVGFLLHGARDQHREIRFSTGPVAVRKALAAILPFYEQTERGFTAPGTSLEAQLQRAQPLLRPGSLLVSIGDFHELGDGFDGALALVRRRADLVLWQVFDPLEAAGLPPGRWELDDGRVKVLQLVSTRQTPPAFEAITARLAQTAKGRDPLHRAIATTDDVQEACDDLYPRR